MGKPAIQSRVHGKLLRWGSYGAAGTQRKRSAQMWVVGTDVLAEVPAEGPAGCGVNSS